MTEQEKFEAWLTGGIKGKPFPKNEDGNYLHMNWQIQWMAWQAAIASREPMTENEMKQVISETSALARFKYQDFVRAIERFHGIGD